MTFTSTRGEYGEMPNTIGLAKEASPGGTTQYMYLLAGIFTTGVSFYV
jgi:hypothetical protein